MTAQINLEETYNELSNVLKEVCSFLNTEIENGALSSTAANHAQKLIYRLKKQAEVVSQISALQESTNSNYPYLQMQGPSLIEEPLSEYVDAESPVHYEEEDYEESYAQIGTESVSLPPPSSLIIEDYCPFLELPLSQLPEKAVKHGPLIRKERYFIIEQKKQLLVGLVGYWLLIYCANKKDVKPLQVLNLTEYRAQAKKDPIFEITGENKKTHEFIAKSSKDMDQWIVAINCKKQINPNVRDLPDIPAAETAIDESTDSLDKVSNNNINNKLSISEDFDSEQDIYENLDDIRKTESSPVKAPSPADTEENTPKLPARVQITYTRDIDSSRNSTYNNVQINISNPLEDDEEENTYDPVQNGLLEDEEEEIYDEPKIAAIVNRQIKPSVPEVNKQTKSKPPIIEYDEDDEECSYDIPRSDNFSQKSPLPSNNYDDYEDEDVEYDELKLIPQNNNVKLSEPQFKSDLKTLEKNTTQYVIVKPSQPQPKLDLKVDKTPEKNKAKPVIVSPKPKLQGRLDKLTAFTRKSDHSESSQEGNNSRRIHNIIQQMESTLTFKGKNN